ncbi:MAG: LacI family DNA-binding transcriptional regulator [Actinobacteria bacterium]|nr:LacI family DNA-binding transcriptional regulator [Actinomycetota bacterium]
MAQGRPQPTLKHVALRAGVSTATASMALRGLGRVSAETRARVQTAASEIGYTTNRTAQKLRTGKKGVIGVVIDEVHRDYCPELPQFTVNALVTGLGYGLAEVGLDLSIMTLRDAPAKARECDGILTLISRAEDIDALALPSEVWVLAGSTGRLPCAYPKGYIDQWGAAVEVLEHFREQGARRPALIHMHQDHSDVQQELGAAYRWWVAERELPENEILIGTDDRTTVSVETLVRQRGVDAIFTGSHSLAFRRAFDILDIGVPHDCLFACVGPGFREQSMTPSVSHVSYLPEVNGPRLTQVLAEMAEKGESWDVEFAYRFVPGDSSRGLTVA